jgi:predicted Zn-dependent peptidase
VRSKLVKALACAFSSANAQFGSLDSRFKPLGKEDFVTVPDGVAHFLEHKLFEKEEESITV